MSDQNPPGGSGGTGALDGSEEPSPLGASATLPAGARHRRGEGSGRVRRLRLPKVGPGRGSLLLVVAIALFACIPLLGTSLKKTPRDKVGISYGGGPIEGAHFQRIVQPGSSLFFNGVFDPLYLYPADQQNYIVSKVANQGSTAKPDAVVAPSKDRVQVSYQVAVYYKLNTDKIRVFHEQFGLKYKAYTAGGWKTLISDTFRQQIENSLQEETRRYTVAEIYGDADLLLKIQTAVQRTLSQRLGLAMGSQYFCAPTFKPGGECTDPTFVLKQVDLPKSVVAAFESNRTSQIQILTKTNEVEQRRQEALGISALNDALQDNGSVYALLKAIESGKVNFWVLPSDGGLTLNTPNGSTAGGSPAGGAPAAGGN